MRMSIHKGSPNKELPFKELVVGQAFTTAKWIHLIDKSNTFVKVEVALAGPSTMAMLISTSIIHTMSPHQQCYPLRSHVTVDLHKEYHP